MRAKAKYKGQVADDAYLNGPVTAEIDYSYTLSGTIRGTGGALATPAGSQVEQHITIPFVVGKDRTPPSIGAFAGGDPTKGRREGRRRNHQRLQGSEDRIDQPTASGGGRSGGLPV